MDVGYSYMNGCEREFVWYRDIRDMSVLDQDTLIVVDRFGLEHVVELDKIGRFEVA